MGCLVLFVAFLIGLLWLFQIIMLDDFYRWDKTRQVRQMSSLIADNADNESLPRLMDRLAQENDTCILLLDSEYRKIASADVVRFCLIHRMSRRDLSWWCSRAPEDGSVATELFQINPYAEEPSDFPSFRGFSPPRDDFVIPWKNICRIGPDIVLVDIEPESCRVLRGKPRLLL